MSKLFGNPRAALGVVLILAALWGALSGGIALGGATLFIVLHEPTKDDLRFAELATALQDESSPASKAATSAGWKVWVLADDAKDKDKNPLPILKTLGVYDTISDARHELLAVAPTGKLVARETLPADATADTVLAFMQARGKR